MLHARAAYMKQFAAAKSQEQQGILRNNPLLRSRLVIEHTAGSDRDDGDARMAALRRLLG